jgi:hypothetical protein
VERVERVLWAVAGRGGDSACLAGAGKRWVFTLVLRPKSSGGWWCTSWWPWRGCCGNLLGVRAGQYCLHCLDGDGFNPSWIRDVLAEGMNRSHPLFQI